MREALAVVVVEFVALGKLAVLYHQLDRVSTRLRRAKRLAQNLQRVAPAVHRNQFHARPDARLRRDRPRNDIADYAVLPRKQSDRKTEVRGLFRSLVSLQVIALHIGINQTPARAGDAA